MVHVLIFWLLLYRGSLWVHGCSLHSGLKLCFISVCVVVEVLRSVSGVFVFEANVHEGKIFFEFLWVWVVLQLLFKFLVKLIDKTVFDLFGLWKFSFLFPEFFDSVKVAARKMWRSAEGKSFNIKEEVSWDWGMNLNET